MKERNVEIASNIMETDGSSNQDDLMPKKGSNFSSVVWKWVGLERSDIEQSFVKYKICQKSVATGSGSTSGVVGAICTYVYFFSRALYIFRLLMINVRVYLLVLLNKTSLIYLC